MTTTNIDWLAVARKAAEDTLAAVDGLEAALTPEAAEVKMPTAVGIYITLGGDDYAKTPLFRDPVGWQFANGGDATQTAIQWHAGAGLVKLEPVAKTAKRLLSGIRDEVQRADVGECDGYGTRARMREYLDHLELNNGVQS